MLLRLINQLMALIHEVGPLTSRWYVPSGKLEFRNAETISNMDQKKNVSAFGTPVDPIGDCCNRFYCFPLSHEGSNTATISKSVHPKELIDYRMPLGTRRFGFGALS